MTIDELIEELEARRDEIGGDAEVRLMTQQQWPFENELRGVVTTEDLMSADACREDDMEEESDDEPAKVESPICFLVEGSQICYGSKKAWDIL